MVGSKGRRQKKQMAGGLKVGRRKRCVDEEDELGCIEETTRS